MTAAHRAEPSAPIPAIPMRAANAPDWVLTVAEVEGWIRRAKPGERLLYAQGRNLIQGDTSAYLLKLAEKKEVMLFQPRSPSGTGFDYIAIRNRVRLVEPAPRQQVGPILDPASSALLLKLKTVAREGKRCPSDAALGEAIGITRNQVGWGMKRLRLANLIATRIEPTPLDPKWRVVTIIANGHETALPPKGAAK